MDISYQYSLARRSFGRQPQLCESGPQLCDSVAADAALQRAHVLRNPVPRAVQHAPRLARHAVNTGRAEYCSGGAQHAEGGWPRDVNPLDPELAQRYRRKVEKDDAYIHCVQHATPGLEHYVLQNNAIDMYQTYYSELEARATWPRAGCRTVNVARDAAARPVASLCWQPAGHRLAAAYAELPPRAGAPLACYVWDAERPALPECALAPPSAALDVQYNARERSVLAGALASGQVCAWDVRRGPAPTVTCAPHVAHRDLARHVHFINAKSGQELFSGSPDGAVKWWDLRRMSEPLEEIVLDVVKYSFDVPSMANACGVSALEFEPTIPTRFMVGTEDGFVISGNRKGKTALEKLPAKFPAHLGPVLSLERNPSFLKNFLTVGDWTARVWSEECRESAVLWSPPLRHRLTAGTWSPARSSLLLLTQWSGALALWDLLRRQHEPLLTVQLCAEPLLRVRVHGQVGVGDRLRAACLEPAFGSLVACGSCKGNIYMAELSQSLAESEKNDKNLLTMVLERESRRERILEARLREIRLKQRQADEGGAGAAGADGAEPAALGDRDLADAAAQYALQVKRDLAAL